MIRKFVIASCLLIVVLHLSIGQIQANIDCHINSKIAPGLGKKLVAAYSMNTNLITPYLLFYDLYRSETYNIISKTSQGDVETVEKWLRSFRWHFGESLALQVFSKEFSVTSKEYNEIVNYYACINKRIEEQAKEEEKQKLCRWKENGLPPIEKPVKPSSLKPKDYESAFNYAFNSKHTGEFTFRIDFCIDSTGNVSGKLIDSTGVSMNIDSFIDLLKIEAEPVVYKFERLEGLYRFKSYRFIKFVAQYEYDNIYEIFVKYDKRKQRYFVDLKKTKQNPMAISFLESGTVNVEEMVNNYLKDVPVEKSLKVNFAQRFGGFYIYEDNERIGSGHIQNSDYIILSAEGFDKNGTHIVKY